jgi:hypothetical protein
MTQTSYNPYRNNNLFSNCYLEKYLPESPEWKKKDHNPKSRVHHDTLKDWYDSSVAKLNPLMTKIDATDALIDQIVYKLYGLTEEEIGIVERKGK